MAKWLPVESNPEVLTAFLRKLGVASPWGVTDVFGLDDELLMMVPEPVAALILLFPSGPSTARAQRLKELIAAKTAPPASTFYAQQLDEASDACGTVALIHACANGGVDVQEKSPLANFLATARALPDAAAKGRALVDAADVRDLSNETARAGETRGAGTDDNQGQHFVAFVAVDGVLLELDGRHLDDDGRAFPVVHGPLQSDFLHDAANLIKRDFLARDPSNLNFSVLALAHLPP